ncbi:RagB/SusD family nutrient uptake outer membrane protein [Wenyingzhuangia sp. IMCC45467]
MKYIYITLIIISQLVSCDTLLDHSDDLSDAGAINDELLYSSEEEIQNTLNGIYAKFASEFYNGNNLLQMTTANTPYFSSTGAKGEEYAQFNIIASTKNLNDTWNEIYACIHNANLFLQQVEKRDLREPFIEPILGQVYFLRALCYFDLVRVFGAVPLRTNPAGLDNLFIKKASKEEIYKIILTDLNTAKVLLPTTEYKEGRPLSYAASGYLAKVYMTMATDKDVDINNFADFTTEATFWGEAKTKALEVYNSGKYSLLTNYADLFDENMPENSVESIFELQYTSVGTATKSGQQAITFSPKNSMYNLRDTGGQVRVNRLAFHDHYLDYNVTIDPDDLTHPDPRVEVTYIVNSYDEVIPPYKNIVLYPAKTNGGTAIAYIKKFSESSNTNINAEKNRIMLRFADVILMLAEIENELGNGSQSKLYIKEVLDRANPVLYPMANIDAIAQGDDLRDRIMKERVYELLGEGQEWFDLRRQYTTTGGTITFLEKRLERREELFTKKEPNSPKLPTMDQFDTKNRVAYHSVWNPDLTAIRANQALLEKNYLFPIPAVEITGNNALSAADQNPGY